MERNTSKNNLYSAISRGTSERPFDNNNGNFLEWIETIAKFDHIMKEHMEQIKKNEIQYIYLGHKIQN